MLARTDLNLGSALVCLLIGGVLLAIVWVIDRRQLRRQETEATGRHAAVAPREDQRLARAERGVRDAAGVALAEGNVPPVPAQELEPTGEVPTRFIKVRPMRAAGAAPPAAATLAPEPVTVAEPEPVAMAEPEPVTMAEPEPVTMVEPEPVTMVEPEPVAMAEPEPVAMAEPEPEPAPAGPRPTSAPGPIVTFTAHAQGARGVRFLDPAAVIDLTDEHAAVRPEPPRPRSAPEVVEPAPVAVGATTASEAPAAPVEPPSVEPPAVEPAAVEPEPSSTPAELPPIAADGPEPAPAVAPTPAASIPDPAPPAADNRVRRRRGRRGRIDEPAKPKLPKGAEAALAAMVEVVPDPRNTVKTTRDPTAEVLLKKAERRAIEEAKAYRPPAPDPVEWETPTEARVEATAPAAEHARADR